MLPTLKANPTFPLLFKAGHIADTQARSLIVFRDLVDALEPGKMDEMVDDLNAAVESYKCPAAKICLLALGIAHSQVALDEVQQVERKDQ